MDSAEIELVRKTLESALATGSTNAVALLDGLGWADLHELEPAVAVGELFEAHGRLRCTTSALDIVVSDALGVALGGTTCVAHPTMRDWDASPGHGGDADTVTFEALVLAGAHAATHLLVPFTADGRLSIATVDRVDLEMRSVQGFDEGLALHTVAGRFRVSGATMDEAARDWETVALAARRALAHEICGLAQSMLDQAIDYVPARHQFGRPIAAFQSVRHRLTEILVALASARAALDASWATSDPFLGDAAKALAGKAGALAARHCLQVTGAIGFTEDYDLAARIRRMHMLDGLYGTADRLAARIGDRLVTDRRVPRFRPLP